MTDLNIPELQNPVTAAAVTTLVLAGNASGLGDAISGIISHARFPYLYVDSDHQPIPPDPDLSLLPGLVNVSLPEFTGTIPDMSFLTISPDGPEVRICPWLEDFSAPHATGIGLIAFAGTGLTTFYLPEVVTVGEYAFQQCRRLEEVYLPAAVTIEEGAFLQCESLITVDLPAAQTIQSYMFGDCPSLTTLKLGYDGEINVPLGTPTGDTLFDGGNDGPNRANTIDLYLGAYEHDNNADVGNKTWKGYTWKSIKPYVPAP